MSDIEVSAARYAAVNHATVVVTEGVPGQLALLGELALRRLGMKGSFDVIEHPFVPPHHTIFEIAPTRNSFSQGATDIVIEDAAILTLRKGFNLRKLQLSAAFQVPRGARGKMSFRSLTMASEATVPYGARGTIPLRKLSLTGEVIVPPVSVSGKLGLRKLSVSGQGEVPFGMRGHLSFGGMQFAAEAKAQVGATGHLGFKTMTIEGALSVYTPMEVTGTMGFQRFVLKGRLRVPGTGGLPRNRTFMIGLV